jgi:hypothetical protein
MPEEKKLKPIKPAKHKTPKAVAKALLKLYRDPRRHTQGTYMRGVTGSPVEQHRYAVSCCLMGGVELFMKSADEATMKRVVRAFDDAAAKLLAPMSPKCSVWVNDTQGIDGVRELLQEVIKS